MKNSGWAGGRGADGRGGEEVVPCRRVRDEKVQSAVLVWAAGLLLDRTEIKVTFINNTSCVILFRSSITREILCVSGQKKRERAHMKRRWGMRGVKTSSAGGRERCLRRV